MHKDCFDVSTYKSMLAGQLTAVECEKVCKHLEECDRCCQVVRGLPEDALVASMRGKGKWPTNAIEPSFVRDLAEKILKQRESRGDEVPSFVVFSCPGCANKLKVKNELAGQKVKCPRCGQVIRIPAVAAAKVPASGSTAPEDVAAARTLPPKDVRSPGVVDAPTVPPANPRTKAPVQKDETNPANKLDTAHDTDPLADQGLIDFLAPPQQPDEIGRLGIYRVLKVLGAGGMGVVYKAEDPGLKRLVAIKAMLPAMAASASAKTRFQREAQAAAAIKHNHIVTIFQVTEDRGVPFLAMEFLEGEPLDSRLKREGRLPMAEVMRIGREMAEGMAAAHERGLIHRDIKPANTWLEASPGRKSGKFTVKILDFGLARATDDQANLTQSGAIIGTPAYMAPEQGRGEKLDARCDLWSLGVVLYCMCTGELPFKGTDAISTLMAVAMNDPPPPAKVNGEVPAGLSELVMKLLEKDPAKRIASAQEVAETLRRLEQTQNEPPSPNGPAPTGSAPQRSKNRKPVLMALAGGLVAAVACGIVLFLQTPDGVIRIESDDPGVKVVFDKDGATIEGVDKQSIRLRPGKHGFVVKRDGFEFVTDNFEMKKGDEITLKIEFRKGKMQLLRNDQKIGEKDFTPSGDPLLAKNDQAKKGDTPPELIKKKELEPIAVSILQKFHTPLSRISSVALSGDGKLVLTGSLDRTTILWDAGSGKEIQSFQGHTGSVVSVALSADAKRVLTGSRDNTAILWDADSGTKIQTFKGHTEGITSVALSGDGKHVLTGSFDKTAILWDADSGKKVQSYEGHSQTILGVALSGDGKHVLTGSLDNTAILWDASSGKKVQSYEGHTGPVASVALSGDGKHILTGSRDGTAILWDAASGKKIEIFLGHDHYVTGVAFSGDGKRVLTGSIDDTAILWDAANGKKIQTIPMQHMKVKYPIFMREEQVKLQQRMSQGVTSVALGGEGTRVLTGLQDGTAILWEVKASPGR